MTDRNVPNIIIEKVNLERCRDDYDVFAESREEFLATETMPKPEISIDDMESMTKEAHKLWETDRAYIFHVLDVSNNQVVGFAQLNLINRIYQMANLSYQVRTSRTGQGIASEAARLVACFGFEKLGLQRIEVVVAIDNAPSLRVAEKIGAVREGLLRNRLLINGSPRDAYMHSLIPTDYLDNGISKKGNPKIGV